MSLEKNDKKSYLKWMLLSLLTVGFFLVILEIIHPYYFMCDDNLDSYIAVYTHTVESFMHGEWAEYNFHQFMGIRFLSHGQTGGFNILTYLSYGISILVFGHRYATVDIVAILHLIVGAFGMFLLLKKTSCSAFASYLGSVVWALNSFTVYLGRSWLVVILVAGFLPFMLLFSINYLEKPSMSTLLISSGWKTLSFYCLGQPQFFAYAIIVDFLFVVPYALVICKKTWKSVLFRYLLSSAIVVYLCLPLLLPMYKEISSSVNRAASYSFETLSDGKEFPACLIISMIFPFLQDGGVTHVFGVFELHAGHIGYVLLFAIPIGLLIFYESRKEEKMQQVRKLFVVLLPALVITLLYGCSNLFLRLVSFIPVINQFRWPMKIIEYSLLFIILLAAMLFDVVFEHFFSGKNGNTRRIATVAVVCINIVNFAGLYYLFTPQLRGLNNSAKIPFEEGGVDIIKSDRYVSIYPTLGDCTPLDFNASMAYNLATVYGMDCYLGYDSIIPDNLFVQNPNLSFTYGGIMPGIHESSIEACRACGVRWYIVYDGDEKYLDEYEVLTIPMAKARLEAIGCEEVYRSGNRVFYYDKEAVPVISCDGAECDRELHGNYILFHTDSQNAVGTVAIHYNYDENLTAYVDGVKTEISALPDGTGMQITVPGGKHEVKIEYSDYFLINFAIDFGVFALVCVVCYIVRCKKEADPIPEEATSA